MVYILTWGTYSGSGWGSGKGWRMEQFVSCRKSQSWELLILDENMVARDYRPLRCVLHMGRVRTQLKMMCCLVWWCLQGSPLRSSQFSHG